MQCLMVLHGVQNHRCKSVHTIFYALKQFLCFKSDNYKFTYISIIDPKTNKNSF